MQKRLQDPKMNFHDSSQDIKALQIEVLDKRETLPLLSLWMQLKSGKEDALKPNRDGDEERRYPENKLKSPGYPAKNN